MPTRAQVEQFRTALGQISGAAKRDLDRLLLALNPDNPDEALAALLEYMPALADTYGEAAAALAAEWFDELADAEGPARFRAVPSPTVAREVIEAKVRYAAGGLFGANLNMAGLLAIALDKYVKQPARDTVTRNASRANARWARVPTGASTCAFCLMLASRGFDFHEHDAGTFHGDCDCQVVPSWADDPGLEGYDPDALYDVYEAARRAAGSGNPRDILAEMRRQQGIR